MNRLEITVAEPDDLLDTAEFGAGALVAVESAATSTGSFSEIGTFPIVSGTTAYRYRDTTGADGTWYRVRYSNAGRTNQSDYSAIFQAPSASPSVSVVPSLQTYAQLGQALPVFETVPTNDRRLERLDSLLLTATRQVIAECGGRDYFRHPASGTSTWVLDGNGSDTLHVHEGLVSLSLLELSFDGGTTYVSVDATDYMLRGDSPYSGEPIPPDGSEPYFHIRFTGFGKYTNFPPTVRSARLTGARGYPMVPVVLVESTVQRMRQLAFADGDYSGSAAGGQDEYGRPAGTDRFWPQSLYNFLQLERERFMGCHIGGTMTQPTAVRYWQSR